MVDVAQHNHVPHINKIAMTEPWRWLAAGWEDLRANPGISLGYGFLVLMLSYALTAGLFFFDTLFLVIPLAAGFMQLAPILAIGLYEASRRREKGMEVGSIATYVVRARSPLQLAYFGFALGFFLLAWIYLAFFLFAIFYGVQAPPMEEFIPSLILTARGVAFLAIGTAVGAVLAFAVFAISAIAVPYLLDRDTDAISAMILSVKAVRKNFAPMMLWAWLIVVLIVSGMVVFYVGLVLVFPLIGHATWHAYRALIDD
ncbi:MAG: DUF2189 domain-containing protein [Alphaproteobacteria bacterium]|nr:DUF2189 domain-containing protein [Alphaproteobacteria bacterium]